uniref:TGF-beta family profile domain-containing protein n=1 Tax=Ciona savignyi TaxID=51511 RepID=H2YGV5_CIOSA
MHVKLILVCTILVLEESFAFRDLSNVGAEVTVNPVELPGTKPSYRQHRGLNGFLGQNTGPHTDQRPHYSNIEANRRELYLKEQESEFQRLLSANQISNTEIGMLGGKDDFQPSILTAMQEQASHAGKGCRLPGQNGNVVRSLRNRGRILYQDGLTTMIELRYHFGVLPQIEKVTSAIVYAAVPGANDGRAKWWQRHNGLRYTYRVHAVAEKYWIALNAKLELSKSTKNDRFTGNVLMGEIEEFLGDEITSRTVTYDHGHSDADSTHPLDVFPVLEKWRREAFHRGDRIKGSRYVLLVTKTYVSEWSINLSDNWASCKWGGFGSGQPRLLLVSIDKSQCENVDGRSNSEENPHQVPLKSIPKIENLENADKRSNTEETIHAVALKRSIRATRSSICQRHSMWIDFEELGWSDWVIAPRSFQSYRCAGECPFPLSGKLNGTNHAMLITMMNSVDSTHTPLPCCVPTRLSSVSMLYLDKKDNVVLKLYEDMVVEACGCR